MPFNHTNILAGTLDNQVEFIAPEVEQVICLNNGKRLSFEEFPAWIIEAIKNDMLENPQFLKELGITEINNPSIFKYTYEMYGGLDQEADIDAKGNFNHSEYFEGSVRKSLPVGEGQHLTKSEIAVLKLAHLPDKLIADQLCNSIETILSHWQNMRNKTGLTGKVELAIWATKKGII